MSRKYVEFLYTKSYDIEKILKNPTAYAYIPFGALERHGKYNILSLEI